MNELIPDGRHALTVTMDAALIDGVALEPEVDIWYADGGRLIPMDEPCRVLATSPEAFTFAIEPEGVPLITDAVSFDLPVIPAAVDDEAHLLEQVMMWHRRQVLGCYDEALSRGGEVDGELVVGWRLDMGVVQEAHVLRDTLERPALTDCVLDHAVDWRFPVTMDGDVHWPFAFRAGHAEERDRGTHRP